MTSYRAPLREARSLFFFLQIINIFASEIRVMLVDNLDNSTNKHALYTTADSRIARICVLE